MMEMSEENGRPVSQTSSKAAVAAGAAAAERRPAPVMFQGHGRPIVLSLKNKKKRRYSSSLKDRQVEMRRSAKAGERFFEAIAAGFGEYRKKSNKSARKKKDGELKDFSKNTASGLAKAIKKMGKMPRVYKMSSRARSYGPQLPVMQLLGSAPVQLAMSAAVPRLLPPPLANAARFLFNR